MPEASRQNSLKEYGLAFLGAVCGSLLGWVIVGWAYSQGFYAIAMLGILIGAFGGRFLKTSSNLFGGFCALFSLVVSLFAEWKITFLEEVTFSEFIASLPQTATMTWVMLAIGSWLAFSNGRGGCCRYLSKRPE